MRRRRWVQATVVVALVGLVSALLGGCGLLPDPREEKAAADAAAAAAAWADPAVQKRWSTAVVGYSPPVDLLYDAASGPAVASVIRGKVELSPEIGDERGRGLVDYTSATDRTVETLGARSTLRTVEVKQEGACWNGGPCDVVMVTSATPTTMSLATARGPAAVPAWSFAVDGLAAPLVLPAVAVASAADVAPSGSGPSASWLLDRDGTTLRVSLVVPYCTSNYTRHLLETDAAVVVWATARPNGVNCAAEQRGIETFTLRAPIGDRPVVDHLGSLLLSKK